MKDIKENSSKLSSKFSDLFDDLQDTLENSIYNTEREKIGDKKRDSGNLKDNNAENDTVSEIFNALNNNVELEKRGRYEKTEKSEKSEAAENSGDSDVKIPRVTPTPSAYDDALKSQTDKFKSKSKSKPVGKIDMLSDTKEMPVRGDSGNTKKQKKENIEIAENITAADYETLDDLDDDEDNSDEIDTSDNSDMDLELLKAIGIGEGNIRSDNASQPDDAEALNKSKPQESKIARDKPDSKKTSVQSPHIFNKAIDKEYIDREQINEIFASYRKSYVAEFIKLSLGIFLFLILFYMEIAPYIKWAMPNALNINYFNLPYIWIDLQILVLVAALNFKSLVFGVKSMLASNINVYSISFFFFAIAFLHTMLTLNLRYNNPNMILYNSIAVYSMVLISLYNLLDMSSEITSFKTVSSKKPKFALNIVAHSPVKSSKNQKSSQPYNSSGLESELFRDVIPYDTPVGGIIKTPFISNFFSRTYKDKHTGGIIKYFVYISLVMALIIFIVSMGVSKEKDWYVALSSITALLLGSLPLCSFIIEVYPVYRAQKKARAIGSAFIGGKSIEESSDAPIISLYDRDIFPANQIKISGIKVYGNNRIDTVLQNLCVVFDKLNMSPADTFKASTNFDRNFNKDIKFINIDDLGICYAANNQKLFLGTPEYISNMGLVPSYDSNFDDPFVKSSGSIMFLASENEVIAKVYIKYEITADFYDIIKNIKKINACLCIRTFDPNIDDELISKLGNIKKYPVKVLKLKNPADVYEIPERTDAPAVSKESIKSLINAVLIAGRTKNILKSNVLIQIFAFAASLILSVILGIAGQLWGINAGHLFLIQSFWFLPVIVLLGITP
ncbi:MAG: hypothetical protein FWF92_05185 [Oscillospiraceae bacterium]|nr:hypothetical protein [Oscillospiraceae bacterium]